VRAGDAAVFKAFDSVAILNGSAPLAMTSVGELAQVCLEPRQTVVTGFETFPDRLLMLFRGDNTGQLVPAVE
jgi:NADPH-dependent curcumin reductase CurA